MGQESLEEISIDKYLIEWEEGLMKELDSQYLKDHFMIGDGGDKDKIAFYHLYRKTFCTDSCELSNWIWKKINGFFEDHDVNYEGEIKSLKYQPVQNITNIYGGYEKWQETSW